MTDAQIRDQAEQKKADREWGKRLEAIHKNIHRGPKQAEAQAELAAIQDPRAVPAIFREFAGRKVSDQRIAVQLFGQISSRASTRALASLAVFSSDPDVRRLATESLRSRDVLDYLGGLLALISDPLKYEVRPVNGPGSTGVLFVEGEQFNVRRLYSPPALSVTPQIGDIITFDEFGQPLINRPTGVFGAFTPYTSILSNDRIASVTKALGDAGVPNASQLVSGMVPPNIGSTQETLRNGDIRTTSYGVQSQLMQQISVAQIAFENQRAARSAQAQLEDDVRAIDAINEARKAITQHVLTVASDASRLNLGKEPKAWRDWLAERSGSIRKALPTKPTIDDMIVLRYNPVAVVLPSVKTTSAVKITET
jgi:hypothetical protein